MMAIFRKLQREYDRHRLPQHLIDVIGDETEDQYIHSVIDLRNHREDDLHRAGDTTQLPVLVIDKVWHV